MSDRLILILLVAAALPGALIVLAGVVAMFVASGKPGDPAVKNTRPDDPAV
jgi:hypothetical protein